MEKITSLNRLTECPICHEICVDHLHYGGISCYSCKAFFRRTVTCPSKKTSRCRRGSGDCNLKLHLRNNCPHCRFKKCIRFGMKPELVLSKHPINSEGNEATLDNKKSNVIAVLPEMSEIQEIARNNFLILSVNNKINLMCVPPNVLIQLDEKIKNYRSNINPNMFLVAQIELAFLSAKQSVSYFPIDILKQYHQDPKIPTQGQIFAYIQEYVVKMIFVFLQNCPCFQSIPTSSQFCLLRKNISEISILLASTSFCQKLQQFSWGLGGSYCEGGGDVLRMKQDNLCEYLERNIVKDIMRVSNILSDMEIPGHLSILLILIMIFSRDGLSMEGHSAVDTARSYYLQLLYRYMKLTNTQSSRLNASLHSILKTVKDYGEAIRSQFVLNFD